MNVLSIKNVSLEDAGDYTVVAKNANGKVSAVTSVSVEKAEIVEEEVTAVETKPAHTEPPPVQANGVESEAETTDAETDVDFESATESEMETETDVEEQWDDAKEEVETTETEQATEEEESDADSVVEQETVETKSDKAEKAKRCLPKFDVAPEPVAVEAGKVITLKCKVSGIPPTGMNFLGFACLLHVTCTWILIILLGGCVF